MASASCNVTLLGRGWRVGVDPLGVALLELDRRDVADRGVQPIVVNQLTHSTIASSA